MALTENALPFGLRQVVLTKINEDGTLGDKVRLPASRTFSFSEAEDFEELRGDDRLITVRGQGPSVNWELEAGGISLAAYQVIAGGTITESGTTPETTRTFRKGGYDQRPFFRVEGRAISDSGGDVHCVLHRCRATEDISGEFTDGEFFLTNAEGQALPDEANDNILYEFIQNEQETEITLV